MTPRKAKTKRKSEEVKAADLPELVGMCVDMVNADDPDEHANYYNAIVDLLERHGLLGEQR